jgi:hypothetical protein
MAGRLKWKWKWKWIWIKNDTRRFNFNSERSPIQMLSFSTLLSALLVLFSQFAIAFVPRFFSSLSLVAMLPLAGLNSPPPPLSLAIHLTAYIRKRRRLIAL